VADHVAPEFTERAHPLQTLDRPVFAEVRHAEFSEPRDEFLGDGFCDDDERDSGRIAPTLPQAAAIRARTRSRFD
jgi:hypothetical protein